MCFNTQRSYITIAITLLGFALASSGASAQSPLTTAQKEFFESRIRPVLAQDCYECHSTATKQKGGLNLDHRSAWQAGGDSGPVIVPGKPDQSSLIQAIRHLDEDLAMPKSGAKLDDAIIKDFVQWVAMGAPDPRDTAPSPAQIAKDQDWDAVLERRKAWWSFQAITNPKPPVSSDEEHPVDRFMEQRREAAGLDRNPKASATVLLRRLSFALIGLPPTPDQIDNFSRAYASNPKRAFDQQVDELLASPQFGERWARHWMDWIRYAESHGSEGDPRITNAHLYRDYLIRALNDDIPYNQLVREHVAGDQLEQPRINQTLGINESLIGTAHWRMVFHGFAPTDALDEKVRFTDDQINVFSKAFLGLTVSCARCHDHKFDAISQKDYYAFFGIFGSTRPSRKAIELPETLNRHRHTLASLKPTIRDAIADDWLQSLDTLSERLLSSTTSKEDKDPFLHPLQSMQQSEATADDWTDVSSQWEITDREWKDHMARDYVRRWHLGNSRDQAQWFTEGTGLENGSTHTGDFSLFGEGEQAVSGIHPQGTFTHLISSKHGGILTSPDFTLDDDYEVWLRIKGDNRSMSRYVVYNYPRNGTVYPVREMGNNKSSWHWERYNVDYWRGDDIHIEVTTGADAPLLTKSEPRSWFGIQEAVIVKRGTPLPPTQPRRFLAPIMKETQAIKAMNADHLANAYRQAIEKAIKAWKAATLTDDQAELLEACRHRQLLPNQVSQLKNAQPLLTRYRELENDIPVATRIPTIAEWVAHDQPLYDRGNHKRPLERVPRRFLESIDPKPYDGELSGRRELAEDVLRSDNPLTRRIIVNRIWLHLFGQGIVKTPDNFGRLGALPSHPDLLEHLATYFSENAQWSLKRLIRYLVTTDTWQLTSEPSEAARAQDPSNDLLSHFSVRRLEAEAIRDSLLHVSGRLDPTAFGNPINGNEPRRSIYVNVIRNRLDPFLTAFDAPVPFSAHGRRNITTVPGQSLTMMNSNFVVTTARSWGHALAQSAQEQGLEVTIASAWQKAFGRRPTPAEIRDTTEFITHQGTQYETFEEAISKERESLDQTEAKLTDLLNKARERVRPHPSSTKSTKSTESTESASNFLGPISEWTFDQDTQDTVGDLHLTLNGKAQIKDSALILDGRDSFAASPPLGKDLHTKTLEIWVQLDNLDQRGGGAMSLQTIGGAIFDSIVYAERESRRWLAGSNNFARTQDFQGVEEKTAHDAPVHFVIVYDHSGSITGYRNGVLYGKAYRAEGPTRFEKGKAEVVFGIRHGSPTAGRMLSGRILEARLYDRALTSDEIAAAASKKSDYVSQSDLIAALTPEEQAHWKTLSVSKDNLTASVNRQAEIAPQSGRDEVWTDLALAIFNMKEFIYVR